MFCKMCNVTHFLLVIGQDTMRSSFKKMCHVTHKLFKKKCDETAFQTMCNVTHSLLVIGKDVMRVPFTKCAMSLTNCW